MRIEFKRRNEYVLRGKFAIVPKRAGLWPMTTSDGYLVWFGRYYEVMFSDWNYNPTDPRKVGSKAWWVVWRASTFEGAQAAMQHMEHQERERRDGVTLPELLQRLSAGSLPT